MIQVDGLTIQGNEGVNTWITLEYLSFDMESSKVRTTSCKGLAIGGVREAHRQLGRLQLEDVQAWARVRFFVKLRCLIDPHLVDRVNTSPNLNLRQIETQPDYEQP
jgi:hypothetical protein